MKKFTSVNNHEIFTNTHQNVHSLMFLIGTVYMFHFTLTLFIVILIKIDDGKKGVSPLLMYMTTIFLLKVYLYPFCKS